MNSLLLQMGAVTSGWGRSKGTTSHISHLMTIAVERWVGRGTVLHLSHLLCAKHFLALLIVVMVHWVMTGSLILLLRYLALIVAWTVAAGPS